MDVWLRRQSVDQLLSFGGPATRYPGVQQQHTHKHPDRTLATRRRLLRTRHSAALPAGCGLARVRSSNSWQRLVGQTTEDVRHVMHAASHRPASLLDGACCAAVSVLTDGAKLGRIAIISKHCLDRFNLDQRSQCFQLLPFCWNDCQTKPLKNKHSV